MESPSAIHTREEQQRLLRPHEYTGEAIPLRYQNCISCGHRTEFTCVKCGYCYSCHWKKEKEERRLIEDKISEIFPSSFLYSGKKVPIKREVRQQQLIPEKPIRQLASS